MSMIEDIKKATAKKTMGMFLANIKRMNSQQLLELLTSVANDTAKNVLKDVEKGMTMEKLNEKWKK